MTGGVQFHASDVDVVFVTRRFVTGPGGVFTPMVNPFARVALRPPGLVTTTFQVPVAAVEGRANVQVIAVDQATTTFVAAISADPARRGQLDGRAG